MVSFSPPLKEFVFFLLSGMQNEYLNFRRPRLVLIVWNPELLDFGINKGLLITFFTRTVKLLVKRGN